jgi:hypothetical protein
MADVAALAGKPEYAGAIDLLWADVVGKKLYITGGIGATGEYEAFGAAYDLPNAAAYAETCAAVGNAFWNRRMFELHGDAKYVDVLERIIYNGILPGVSLSGDSFFYQNPLESAGKYERSRWFEVACCPANVARFLPTIGSYMYAARGDDLFVNLFAAGNASVKLPDRSVDLIQETKYPWDGAVKILVNPSRAGKFSIMVRIPGWAQNQAVPGDLYRFLDRNDLVVRLLLNRKPVPIVLENGYVKLERKWRRNDLIELALPMPVRRVVANDLVKEDAGRVALQRGPILYCAEGIDNGGHALNLVLPDDARVTHWLRPDLLGGVAIITAKAEAVDFDAGGKIVCRRAQDLMAVPYFGWANRGPDEMAVWLPRTESAVKPPSQRRR